jgi:hypothetical protein
VEIGQSRVEAARAVDMRREARRVPADRCRYVSVKISAKELVSCALTAAL